MCKMSLCENLTYSFSGSPYYRWLIMTNYIFNFPLKNVKNNAICFELFWYKAFVHWKLKLLSFLTDSALSQCYNLIMYRYCSEKIDLGNWQVKASLHLYYACKSYT